MWGEKLKKTSENKVFPTVLQEKGNLSQMYMSSIH